MDQQALLANALLAREFLHAQDNRSFPFLDALSRDLAPRETAAGTNSPFAPGAQAAGQYSAPPALSFAQGTWVAHPQAHAQAQAQAEQASGADVADVAIDDASPDKEDGDDADDLSACMQGEGDAETKEAEEHLDGEALRQKKLREKNRKAQLRFRHVSANRGITPNDERCVPAMCRWQVTMRQRCPCHAITMLVSPVTRRLTAALTAERTNKRNPCSPSRPAA